MKLIKQTLLTLLVFLLLPFLFVAIFLMRFSGQGMMSHTASTTS